ncbi:MAG: hypothetical protein ED557_01790 [Balneola sp.]|nr:MAG: hypothetical protein ED557_01790 [Balneola sp.]
MKKTSLFILLLLISYPLVAQNVFEVGYYIDNDDNIVPGLILNLDWRSNPSEIRFKKDSLAQEMVLSLDELNGFEIYDYGKFLKFSVEIDRSSENKSNLSDSPTPLFNSETILLKSLAEGAISLYSYQDGNLQRFFIKKRNGDIEQLVFRFFTRGSRVITDDSFKQQLISEFGCSLNSQNVLEETDYKKGDLINLVIEENACMGDVSTIYTYKRDYKKFRLTIKPGVSISNLKFDTMSGLFIRTRYTSDFDNNLVLNLGTEAEFILPYANGAWSITFQASYHQFEFEDTFEVISQEREVAIDYKALELELGMRYNYILNEKSRIYLSPYLVYGFDFNSKITISPELPTLDLVSLSTIEINPQPSFKIALGFAFKKINFESSYSFRKELLENENSNGYVFDAENSLLNFSIGYSIF